MICRNCGTENPENAVYCGACGKRLDGKKPCPSCNGLNEETSSFCVFCGKKIAIAAAEETSVQNGNANDGASEEVNAEISATDVTVYATNAPVGVNMPERTTGKTEEKITALCDKIQSIALFVGACFALLFVFFIGGAFSLGDRVGDTSEYTGLAPANNLWYFFGNVYKDVANAQVGTKFNDGLNKATLLGFGITGTVTMALALIGTIVFSLRAAFAFVAYAQKKTEKRPDKYALGAIMSFLLGALAFILLNTYGFSMTFGISIEAVYELNAVTEWGIALAIVALLLASVCAVGKKGRAVTAKNALQKTLIFAAVVLVGAISLGVAQIAATSATVKENSISMSMDVGFSKMASAMISSVPKNWGILSDSLRSEVQSKLLTGTVAYTLATVLSVGALVCIGFSLWKKIGSLFSGKLQSGEKLSIVGAVFALVVLIATIVGNVCMEDVGEIIDKAVGSTENFEFGLGSVIVVFVFSVINAIGSFVMKRFCLPKEVNNA